MDWLVTYSGPEPEAEVWRRLREAGALADPVAAAIPLGEAERAFEVSAPEEVAARLSELPGVKGVHPNSGQTAYR